MKKQIITFSALACLAISGVSAPIAQTSEGQRSGEHGKPGGDAMRVLKQVDLSEQQKLDIKALIQQTREDNSVFAGEKQEIMLQMRELMNMPVWDAQTAGQLISSQMEQGKSIRLNRAETKHQIYNVLTNEQKVEMAAKAEQPDKNRGKQKGQKRKAKMQDRLLRALALTDDQQAQWRVMHTQTKALKEDFKAVMKAHHKHVKALVQTEVFNVKAWLALQEGFTSQLVAHSVLIAESKYNTKALLSDEQNQTFLKIKNKMKDKRRM